MSSLTSYLQHASFSSEPSLQSCFPSHNFSLPIHCFSTGHKNLLSGHDIIALISLENCFKIHFSFSFKFNSLQFASSLESVQSECPSHFHREGIQIAFEQRNCPS